MHTYLFVLPASRLWRLTHKVDIDMEVQPAGGYSRVALPGNVNSESSVPQVKQPPRSELSEPGINGPVSTIQHRNPRAPFLKRLGLTGGDGRH